MIPWRTDAPLYHLPTATVALILANVVVWLACMSFGPEWANDLILTYSDGLHPLQWFSSLFIHADPIHLIGNMIFLWVFGMIVEGKLGWWKFLLLYFGIGVTQSAVEQMIFLSGHFGEYSLGASAAIFGLLAVSMVWAPENEVSCVFPMFMFARIDTFELKVFVFGIIYILWSALQVALSVTIQSTALTSGLLHLMGVGMGIFVGVAMLKLKWVDCENWDVFAMFAGRSGEAPQLTSAELAQQAEEKANARVHSQYEAEHLIASLLEDGKPQAAMAVYKKKAAHDSMWQMPEAQLRHFIVVLEHDQQWDEMVTLLRRHLELYPSHEVRMRLKLAEVLVRRLQRPRQALRVLARIPTTEPPGDLDAVRRKLVHTAEQLVETGTQIEVGAEDW